jgi:hypothetical protein
MQSDPGMQAYIGRSHLSAQGLTTLPKQRAHIRTSDTQRTYETPAGSVYIYIYVYIC